MKTAVEFLEEQIEISNKDTFNDLVESIEIAKKMEKNISDEVPIDFQKYLMDEYKKICKVEGKLKMISKYGGSIFAIFQNNRTYRFNISLYQNEIILD